MRQVLSKGFSDVLLISLYNYKTLGQEFISHQQQWHCEPVVTGAGASLHQRLYSVTVSLSREWNQVKDGHQ